MFPAARIVERIPTRRLPEPPVAPQLLWPSIRYGQGIENEDAARFPTRDRIEERHAARGRGTTLMLLAFAAVVAQAEVRILVLDPHFDTVGVAALGPALDSCRAQDVRLLTSGSDIERQQRESLRRGLSQHLNLNQSYAPRLEVRWNANLDRRSFPFLHDRFAVVDSDLWHFGSNVGGGHPGLTAASGPWSATAARAAEFFEECWGSCNA